MPYEIGKILKKHRIEKDISIKEISDILTQKGFKASEKTIYSWEIGNSSPTPDALLVMCWLYGIADILSAFGYTSSNTIDKPIATYSESKLLEKYRCLPDNGKEMVNMVLDNEYGRIDKNAPPLVHLPTTVAPTKEPAPEPRLPSDESLALSLYTQLDTNDKGEIKGEMKGMLKTEKYTTKKVLKNA